MKKVTQIKKIFFDLNHPADFHLFKDLISRLEKSGYECRVTARDKEVLHELLRHRGISFINRGKGSHSLIGKYVFGIFVLIRVIIELIRFRPFLSVSLSSPYLIIASKLLGIPTITYDDTDINPKLLPWIQKSDFIFSPATYPHHFHENHFRLETFKELAYLHPDYTKGKIGGTSVFFRVTLTSTIHHSGEIGLDFSAITYMINKIGQNREVFISAEDPKILITSDGSKMPDRLDIHKELLQCSAFWGNSPTMAAEAAIMGIPAVFVGAQKFAYIEELEKSGLVFCYSPVQLDQSFAKLNKLLEASDREKYRRLRDQVLENKIDMTELLYSFIKEFPQSTQMIKADREWPARFRISL